MDIGLTLVALFLASGLYAIGLQTRIGKRLCARRTWLTVIVGNTLVLAALYTLLSLESWLLCVGAFAIAGVPVVARSLYNELRDEAEAMRGFRK